jgi:hypothetical protein
MKMKFFAALAGVIIVATGCVNTVSDTNTFGVPFTKDTVEGRYNRTVDQVYKAAVNVVKNNGAIVTEYIPHYTTNTVVSLQGRVNQQDIWVRVEGIDAIKPITSVTVQARSKSGMSNVDLAHELEKEIALQLMR